MHGIDALQSQDLKGLTPEALQGLAQQLLVRVQQQQREIAHRDAKIEKITFELARLKRWKFGARTEAMDAQQRQLFLDTLVEDEADLQVQLAALQARQSPPPVSPEKAPQPPRRQALPEHLRRVEHHHEPADTHCPAAGCGEPMTRVGEDVSERLDIVPAEFFVHRHIRGKWVCRCCQRQGVERLVQEPAEPQIIERGIPASGLVAYTLISRFADHMPYYRQEAINARSGVHTPRSTLAAWAGQAGAALHPLHEALQRFVLGCAVVQADETTVALLDPGAGCPVRPAARPTCPPRTGIRPGAARSCATATAAMTRCSTPGSSRSASRRPVRRTHGASSTNSPSPARAPWPLRRSCASRRSTMPRSRSPAWTTRRERRPAKASPRHCGRSCTPG